MVVKQSSTARALVFLMVDSTDHITGKTGLSPTVTLSKNGAAFASPAGAVTEIANGWYKVAGNATDTNTLGAIALHATGTAADPTDSIVAEVVAYDPDDAAALGLSRIDAAITSRLAPTVAARTLDVSSTGEAGLDFANVNLPVGAVPALGIVENGTAQAATGTTLQGRAADAYAADTTPVGATLLAFGSTQGYWQARAITGYVAATKTYTVDAWTVTPSGTITYIVIGTAPASATALPTVLLSPGTGTGQVLLTAGQVTVGTNNDKSGYSLSQSFPANFASMSITPGGLMDITQAAADKVWGSATRTLTAISTALALSVWDVLEASIGTANSIGLKLKKFSFNGSNEVAANTESINNTPVLGTGGAADKWRG
jgi:hypothetical protein